MWYVAHWSKMENWSFKFKIFYIELYILVHGIQITFCIQNTKVHVNIYRVIGHKTIKTKQKTNALLILETQNFKTSTLATSATMPEWVIYIYNYTKSVTIKKC